jgi:hypothetical protein
LVRLRWTLVVVDIFHPLQRDQVVLEAAAQVQLGQFDLAADHMVHAADMAAVRTDHFLVFADLRGSIICRLQGFKRDRNNPSPH